MMGNISGKTRSGRKQAIVFTSISALLLILSGIAKTIGTDNPYMIEEYFSRGIYPVTSRIQTVFANLFPFSLYECVIAVLVVFVLCRTARLIRAVFKKDFPRELINFLTGIVFPVSLGIFLFQFLWNLNNYRLPLKDQLGLNVSGISQEDLADTYKSLILKANGLRSVLSVQDTARDGEKVKKILETAWEGYIPLAEQYNIFHSYRVRVKGLLFSRIQTISGYTGVYSFITGEPNINTEPPIVTLPHTACHEIAHQMGITFEDEANFAAFLACKNHPDILFQYSGYLSALTYTGNALYSQSPDLYREISQLLSESIKSDQEEIRNFWNRYQKESATRIADMINETYLKNNNQPAGIQSYGKFAELLAAYYIENNSI